MSHEVFMMIKRMDLKNIETQLALQCAPLITGLKLSNLLSVTKENEKLVRAFLKRVKISYYCLVKTEKNVIFLVFNRKQLEEYLLQTEARELLLEEGYEDNRLGIVLRTFQIRYQEHIEKGIGFPHEMGIILGYPITDVKGFIKHKGKKFLHSGYWKVYGNVEETVKLFQEYELAKENVIKMLADGISMDQIINYYREDEFAAA